LNANKQLVFLAASIFLGIAFPALASLCKPLLLPMVFLLFVFAILQVSFGDAAVAAFRGIAVWIILLWQLVALPLLALLLFSLHLDSELLVFGVVALCSCSITATTALSRMLGLNDALALVVGLIGSLLMPLPLYLAMQYGLGLDTVINPVSYLLRVLLFIVVPFALVYVLREIISESQDALIRKHVPTAVIGLLMIFGLAVMDGVQALLIDDPWTVFTYVLFSFCLSIAVQIITRLALAFLGSRDASTAAILCSYRNVGVIAALTGESLGSNFLIFLGLWQLPMYTLPILLRKYYQA
jgi:BASS family bile acid:Na+ symporter